MYKKNNDDKPYQMLTPADLQEIFKCSKNRAYQLIHSIGFPAMKLGGRYYIDKRQLDKWIDFHAGRSFATE